MRQSAGVSQSTRYKKTREVSQGMFLHSNSRSWKRQHLWRYVRFLWYMWVVRDFRKQRMMNTKPAPWTGTDSKSKILCSVCLFIPPFSSLHQEFALLKEKKFQLFLCSSANSKDVDEEKYSNGALILSNPCTENQMVSCGINSSLFKLFSFLTRFGSNLVFKSVKGKGPCACEPLELIRSGDKFISVPLHRPMAAGDSRWHKTHTNTEECLTHIKIPNGIGYGFLSFPWLPYSANWRYWVVSIRSSVLLAKPEKSFIVLCNFCCRKSEEFVLAVLGGKKLQRKLCQFAVCFQELLLTFPVPFSQISDCVLRWQVAASLSECYPLLWEIINLWDSFFKGAIFELS